MDQALEQVAEWVALELGPSFEPTLSPDRDRAARVLEEAVAKCASSLVDDRKVAEVFLCNRRDQTNPLGQRWTMLTDGLRDRMRQMLLQIRPDANAVDASLHADMLVSITFGLAEAHLDGRVENLERASAVAARAVVTSVLSDAGVEAAA